MREFFNGFSEDSVGRVPDTPSAALAYGISLLYRMVGVLCVGEVVLTAKVHAGHITLVECQTTDRVFPVLDSSDRTPAVSGGVTLDEMIAWFRESAMSKEYGDVRIVCTVRDGQVVRVHRNDGDRYLVSQVDEVANAA